MKQTKILCSGMQVMSSQQQLPNHFTQYQLDIKINFHVTSGNLMLKAVVNWILAMSCLFPISGPPVMMFTGVLDHF